MKLKTLSFFIAVAAASFFAAALNSTPTYAVLWNDATYNMFSQNDIIFYNCTGGSGSSSSMDSSFKVDSSVNPWYAEGSLIPGTQGIYYEDFSTGKSKYRAGWQSGDALKLADSTQADEELGTLQYVYAENYNISWGDGCNYVCVTYNGGNSTTKYYWVVLPDKVYSNAIGETFLATFEKISEPIHLIVFDTHAAVDQGGTAYTDLAVSDPDKVICGEGCLGSLNNYGGSGDVAYEATGGITGLHRLTGDSEPLLEETESGSGATASSGSNSDSSSDSSDYDGSDLYIVSDSQFAGRDNEFTDWAEGGDNWAEYKSVMPNVAISACSGAPIRGKYDGCSPKNDWGYETVKSIVDSGKIRKKLLLNLGYNDNVSKNETKSRLQEIITYVKNNASDTVIYLFNYHTPPSWFTDMYNELANDNDNIKVMEDFSSYFWGLDNAESKYTLKGDNTHLNSDGAKIQAQFIADQLGSCTSSDFKWYGQSGESWSSYTFKACGTISACGCGPTSFAMLATMLLGKDITPDQTAKVVDEHSLMTGDGSSWTITEVLAEEYGLEYEKIPTQSNVSEAVTTINKYLQEGWMVHVSNTHHYFGIRELTSDGKWLLADSASEENSTTPRDPASVLNGISGTPTDTQVYLENLHAIRSDGKTCSGSETCDAGTEDDGTGLKDGGFTSVEEADKFMDNYRALKDLTDAELLSKYAIPTVSCSQTTNSIENCYAFSIWFLNTQTDLCGDTPCNPGSGKGNADILASAIADEFGLKTGTEPRPYAIFSVAGPHTGVVLGVDQANDKIIIGEAGCDSGFDFIGAHEYSLSSYTSGYTYVYLDDHLKM